MKLIGRSYVSAIPFSLAQYHKLKIGYKGVNNYLKNQNKKKIAHKKRKYFIN